MLINISDGGMGIPEEQLRLLNRQLARPSLADATVVRQMGLFAVAHLAVRHGIKVTLEPRPGGGTTAVVRLPAALISKGAKPGGWPGHAGEFLRAKAGGRAVAGAGAADPRRSAPRSAAGPEFSAGPEFAAEAPEFSAGSEFSAGPEFSTGPEFAAGPEPGPEFAGGTRVRRGTGDRQDGWRTADSGRTVAVPGPVRLLRRDRAGAGRADRPARRPRPGSRAGRCPFSTPSNPTISMPTAMACSGPASRKLASQRGRGSRAQPRHPRLPPPAARVPRWPVSRRPPRRRQAPRRLVS